MNTSDDGENTMMLQFINMSAASAEERKKNQKVVRSMAMKSYRRKQRGEERVAKSVKRQDVSEEASVGISGTLSHSVALSTGPFSDIRFSDLEWLVSSPSTSSSSNDSSAGIGEEGSVVREETQTVRNMRVRTSAIISPRTLLGAGRIDPFQVYPVDVDHTSHAPELIDHSVTVVWRGLRPRGDNGLISSLGAAWLQRLNESPIVMNAMLFGAQVHMDVLRSPRLSIDNPVRLFYKVQTMRLLKAALKNHEKSSLDDMILAILTLSTNEVETVANNVKEKERSPFNSLLASMQWLDVYGSITHHSAHIGAMRSLVSRRGGLKNIELEGLAEVLSFADILGSMQSLKKPYWRLLERTLSSEDIIIPDTLKLPLERLGQGFLELMPLGVNDAMLGVIQAVVNLTMVIDCHCRGTKLIADMTQFIDRRNAVQYQLMSLKSGDDLMWGEVTSTSLYESIRLATIIYSAGVTFPLPPLTGIFHRLGYTLRDVLEKSNSDYGQQPASKVLLWMLVLGGIAASGSNEKYWYVETLSIVSKALELSEWDEVSVELGSYLWLESACDCAGRDLWSEVTNFMALRL